MIETFGPVIHKIIFPSLIFNLMVPSWYIYLSTPLFIIQKQNFVRRSNKILRQIIDITVLKFYLFFSGQKNTVENSFFLKVHFLWWKMWKNTINKGFFDIPRQFLPVLVFHNCGKQVRLNWDHIVTFLSFISCIFKLKEETKWGQRSLR